MKIQENFVLRQIADTWVVIPVGTAIVNMDGMLNMNESGAMLWKLLEQGASCEQLVEALLAEYDVSREVATRDVDEFITRLQNANCLED